MKTAEQKAAQVVAMMAIDGIWFPDHVESAIKRLVTDALKEQDRDTRHACAEAVVLSNNNEEFDEILHIASNACMNVKAV